jgi:prepilin-type N-terminal cleavage/methylation domain-containing protein
MLKILKTKGMTMIELLIVILVIAILASILVISLSGYTSKATEAKDAANARSSYSEVQLAAQMGNMNDSGEKSVGGGTCTFTIVTRVVTEYSCVMKSGTYSLEGNFIRNKP